MLQNTVAFLELLFAAHPQRQRRDLLEVAFLREEQVHRIVGNILFLVLFLQRIGVDDHTLAGLGVFFDDGFQLLDDDRLDFLGTAENGLQLGNILL